MPRWHLDLDDALIFTLILFPLKISLLQQFFSESRKDNSSLWQSFQRPTKSTTCIQLIGSGMCRLCIPFPLTKVGIRGFKRVAEL